MTFRHVQFYDQSWTLQWERMSEDEVKNNLETDVQSIGEEGSDSDSSYPSDDELSDPQSKWLVNNGGLEFKYKRSNSSRYKTVPVENVSQIPVSDKVLTKNGNLILSPECERVIRDLSHLFVRSVGLYISRGPFDCATRIAPLGQGRRNISLWGDRPFPYYYSARHPTLNGSLFHSVTIPDTNRVVKFVKLGGRTPLPEEMRRTIIYLLPISQPPNTNVDSRFIPLDRPISLPIKFIGGGKNIYITRYWVMTTSKTQAEFYKQYPGTEHLILEVNDGVVEKVEIDETVYPPEVVKIAKELSGQHILLYTPLEEAQHWQDTCYLVEKRLRRYKKLLEKIGGSWPSTITELQQCLRVTMKQLIVAALFDKDVRKRIPEPNCFLGAFIDWMRYFCEHDWNINNFRQYVQEQRNLHQQQLQEQGMKGSTDVGGCGLPVAEVMKDFYTYSSYTKSYYSINRPVDCAVSMSSNGEKMHITEHDDAVAVDRTPYCRVVGG